MKKLMLSAMLVFVLAFTACTEKEEKKDDTKSEEKKEETTKKEIIIKDNEFCPVSDESVEEDVFMEYKGNKVFFCCNSCKGKFEKDPKKYTMKQTSQEVVL